MTTYIFIKEVRKWGVEAGDYFNPEVHRIQGGAEKLLKAGIIEEEKEPEIPSGHQFDYV